MRVIAQDSSGSFVLVLSFVSLIARDRSNFVVFETSLSLDLHSVCKMLRCPATPLLGGRGCVVQAVARGVGGQIQYVRSADYL